MEMIVAALYVMPNGPYYGQDGVIPYGLPERDARQYAGPWPVVAHPPCERWGRYWGGGPMLHGTPKQKKLGDDNGCFGAALSAVREFGGVIEHPEASHAWSHFGLNKPPRAGGWVRADEFGGWTCCVEQGFYGHLAAKATWLYVIGTELPELRWGRCGKRLRIDPGFHSREERRRLIKTGVSKRLSKRQRTATPIEFRDLLLGMARSVYEQREAHNAA